MVNDETQQQQYHNNNTIKSQLRLKLEEAKRIRLSDPDNSIVSTNAGSPYIPNKCVKIHSNYVKEISTWTSLCNVYQYEDGDEDTMKYHEEEGKGENKEEAGGNGNSVNTILVRFLNNSKNANPEKQYDHHHYPRLSSVRTLVLLGERGVGKTTCLLNLERKLWYKLDSHRIGNQPMYVPIYVELQKIGLACNSGRTLKEIALDNLQGSVTEADLLVMQREFQLIPLFLLDGFDEMYSSQSNLFTTDLFDCGVSIVTCRSNCENDINEAGFVSHYLTPIDTEGNTYPCMTRFLRPFSKFQIQTYLEKWFQTAQGQSLTASKGYTLESIEKLMRISPVLQSLAHNPYMLSFMPSMIPKWSERYPDVKNLLSQQYPHDLVKVNLNVYSFVRDFVMTLMDKDLKRFVNHPNWPHLFEETFHSECIEFCEDLAYTMFKQKPRTKIADLSNPDFAPFFPYQQQQQEEEEEKQEEQQEQQQVDQFKDNPKLFFILEAIPVRNTAIGIEFTHEALYDHFLASRLVAPITRNLPKPDVVPFLIKDLGVHLFTRDKDLLVNHAQAVSESTEMQNALVNVVLESRTHRDNLEEDRALVTASSNAMTILHFGETLRFFKFSFQDQLDWSNIRVPGATLTYAMLADCDLSGADLSGVLLAHACLNGSNLRGANLTNVMDRIPEDGILFAHFNRDGTYLLVVNEHGVSVRDVTKQWTLVASAQFDNLSIINVFFDREDDKRIVLVTKSDVLVYSFAQIEESENENNASTDAPPATELKLVGKFSTTDSDILQACSGESRFMSENFSHELDDAILSNCLIIATVTELIVWNYKTDESVLKWLHEVPYATQAWMSPSAAFVGFLSKEDRSQKIHMVNTSVRNSILARGVISCATFDATGQLFFVGFGFYPIVHGYEAESLKLLSSLKGGCKGVSCLDVDIKNNILVVCASQDEKYVELWDIATSTRIVKLTVPRLISKAVAFPDCMKIAGFRCSSQSKHKLFLLDHDEFKQFEKDCELYEGGRNILFYSHVQSTLMTRSYYHVEYWDRNLRNVCRTSTIEERIAFTRSNLDGSMYVANSSTYYADDGLNLYSAVSGEEISKRLYTDVQQSQDRSMGELIKRTCSVDFCPSNRMLAIVQELYEESGYPFRNTQDGWVLFWDVHEERVIKKIKCDNVNKYVYMTVFSRDGEYILIVNQYPSIPNALLELYRTANEDEVRNGKEDLQLLPTGRNPHGKYVKAKYMIEVHDCMHQIVFHPLNNKFVIFAGTQVVRVFDRTTFSCIQSWDGYYSFKLSSDGRYLALISLKGVIIVETQSWNQIGAVLGKQPVDVEFIPHNSSSRVVISYYQLIQIFEISPSACKLVFKDERSHFQGLGLICHEENVDSEVPSDVDAGSEPGSLVLMIRKEHKSMDFIFGAMIENVTLVHGIECESSTFTESKNRSDLDERKHEVSSHLANISVVSLSLSKSGQMSVGTWKHANTMECESLVNVQAGSDSITKTIQTGKLSIDGCYWAYVCKNDHVVVVSSKAGGVLQLVAGHDEIFVNMLCFSDDARFLATHRPGDQSIVLWDVSALQEVDDKEERKMHNHHAEVKGIQSTITVICLNSTGSQLAVGYECGLVELWSTVEKDNPVLLQNVSNSEITGKPVRSLCFHRMDELCLLASGHDEGLIRVWEFTSKGNEEKNKHLKCLAHMIDETVCVVGRSSCLLQDTKVVEKDDTENGDPLMGDPLLRDPEMGDPQKEDPPFFDSSSSITCLRFHPSSKDLVSGSEDGAVRVWSYTQPDGSQLKARLIGHNTKVNDIAFYSSLDNHIQTQLFVTCSSDGTIRQWDLALARAPSSNIHSMVPTMKRKLTMGKIELDLEGADCRGAIMDSEFRDLVGKGGGIVEEIHSPPVQIAFNLL